MGCGGAKAVAVDKPQPPLQDIGKLSPAKQQPAVLDSGLEGGAGLRTAAVSDGDLVPRPPRPPPPPSVTAQAALKDAPSLGAAAVAAPGDALRSAGRPLAASGQAPNSAPITDAASL